MANSYTWKVTGLMVQSQGDLTNVAVMSNFTVSGTDGTHTGQVSYSVNLLPADAQNFTPYNSITEEQALEWTQDALGADRVAAMQGEVDYMITQAAVVVPQPAPLPWA
jgi:hypothetical protein